MTGSRDVELEKNYFTELDATKAESICNRCESNKNYLLQYSPIIRFLTNEVDKLGGDLNEKNILCRMCTNEQSGGFSLDYGILLCANKFRNRGHQEDTMAHEMVHAWDHLKWKVEANNLKHQACLEVCNYPYRTTYMDCANIATLDPRLYPVRRMSLHTRVLHTKPMEHNRATAGLCTEACRAVHDAETADQGRGARKEGGERGLGELFQRHTTLRRDLQVKSWIRYMYDIVYLKLHMHSEGVQARIMTQGFHSIYTS